MSFQITGRIREKQSGLGVPHLLIRAYDKDLLYDDLLGNSQTDEKGCFSLSYSEEDFQELFDKKPDIYLSVYAPPYRLITDTKKSIRWQASADEHFELELDRETLGDLSPQHPLDKVEGGIELTKKALKFETRGTYELPKLDGFSNGGPIGAPALPEQMQYIVLPLGGDILGLEIHAGDAVPMARKAIPLPVQQDIPIPPIDVNKNNEEIGEYYDYRFTSPDPHYYGAKSATLDKLVTIEHVEVIGAVQIAAVKLKPLQYDPVKESYQFYPQLRYVIKFDYDKAKRLKQKKGKTLIGALRAKQLNTLFKGERVHFARDVLFPELIIPEEVPHVIITDQYQWPECIDRGDGSKRPPTLAERGAALTGNVVAEMERLAEWKTSLGLRSRVITISEIIGGDFGDFTENGFARDLQEVIRNFVKYIEDEWGTIYLLLAGDVNVVPMRHLVGSETSPKLGCTRSTENPPPEGKCHLVSGKGIVKLHTRETADPSAPMSTYHGALRIPFNREAGSGYLGWYCTNEEDFTTKDEGFIRLSPDARSHYVIVEGPEILLDDDFYWQVDDNSIPSDFYYASISGSHYSIPGRHDFDSNNNEIYGQYHKDDVLDREVPLDEINLWSNVWVGRAPIENGAQAEAFVNKVISYERLTSADGTTETDTTYLEKVIYVAEYWMRLFQLRQTDSSNPPAIGKFTHEAGTTLSKIHLKSYYSITIDGGAPSHRLVAQSNDQRVVIPYSPSPDPAHAGWSFATDDTYTTPSATETLFVMAVGPENEINPTRFFWDPIGLESATEQKEYLRGMMNDLYPEFNSVQRHYWDYFDLPTPPALIPIDEDDVRAALDNGVHFASLSGHGGWAGCCATYIHTRPDFANTQKPFIMFVNSCLTARPDNYDSLGEVSVLDRDGGAVAYVGNTRAGFVGLGDNYEEFFWKKLAIYNQPGPAAGMRLATGGVHKQWTHYAQILYGDPSMMVWTRVPGEHEVAHPQEVNWGASFSATVRSLGFPVEGRMVTLMGGWSDSSQKPGVLITKTTNSFGQVSFDLPSAVADVDTLRMTVQYPNYKPYVGNVSISS